jgi:predicted small metal-binding protein
VISVRVVECNVCGETVAASNDDELLQRLRTHVEAEHKSLTYDEGEARETIAREAYDASDS